MKYRAPKAEMFAAVTFVENYRAYLGSEPFKLRVDNRALSWLKTYSMDQSYIGGRIVRLDSYDMIIELRTRNNYQNADSFSKKTEFYERQEQREADRPEIKDGFSFLDKETYDSFSLTRWIDKSGKPVGDHPELPAEHEANEILKTNPGMPMEMMLKSKIVSETLKAKNYNLYDVETGRLKIGEDLRRLLEKLADEKHVVWNDDKDNLEVTLLKRGEAAHGENSLTGEQPDDKEIVRTLVE